MKTRRETQELIDKNQMKTDMKILLELINETTNYDLSIVEDETDPPLFVISLKYKSYTDNKFGFVHRITNLEAEYLAKNIFENLKEIQGKDFILKDNYDLSNPININHQSHGSKRYQIRKQESYSSPIMDLYKEIYAEIRFYEGKGYM